MTDKLFHVAEWLAVLIKDDPLANSLNQRVIPVFVRLILAQFLAFARRSFIKSRIGRVVGDALADVLNDPIVGTIHALDFDNRPLVLGDRLIKASGGGIRGSKRVDHHRVGVPCRFYGALGQLNGCSRVA